MNEVVSTEEHQDPEKGARKAVIAALFANLLVAAGKFVASYFSHSSAMLAEAVHSVADTVNQAFLLLGMKLGSRAPTESHPYGYGRERYFWAFIVALSIFSLGGLFSFYHGIEKILDPHPIKNAAITFVVLGAAMLFESFALRVAWKEFQHWRLKNPGPLWAGLKLSKSPTILVVIFEDSAALLGILAAAAGITITIVTGNAVWDGIASVVIGLILFGAAYFLGWRTHRLLIGEAATPSDRQRIREAVEGVPEVASLLELLTLHLAPNEILVNLNVNFRDGLDTDAVEGVIDRIEVRIREAVPAATRIFIEAESLKTLGRS